MTFDMKAWKDANRERVKLYSVRYRMKKKGLAPLETPEQMAAEREARKTASKERARERKKAWAQANKERKNQLYRERYHSDPEFRRREIDKRMKAFRLSDEEKLARREARKQRADEKKALVATARKLIAAQNKEERARRRREEAAKKKRLENALRHSKALEKAASITPKRKTNFPPNARKPGRIAALAGWMGW